MPDLLRARAVTVRRGRRTVLRDVSFGLAGGRAVHLAGANGSGKTSLLRVLAGLAAPRGGAIERGGACAFVPERVALAPALRCGEWLRAMRGLRGLPPADWDAAAAASGLDPAVLGRATGTHEQGDAAAHRAARGAGGGAARCCCSTSRSPGSTATGATGSRPGSPRAHGRRRRGAAHRPLGRGGRARRHRRHAAAGRRALRGRGRRAGGRARRSRLVLRASHPDGRRLERAVAVDEVDAVLRDLLDGGWHIEELRP